MDGATPAPPVRPAPPAWGGLVLAPFVALGMTAVASCAIAILAVPFALLTTHDGYVAALAVSYGPYAAAQVLVSVAVATTLWGIVWFVARGRPQATATAIGGGAAGGLIGLWCAPLPLLGFLAAPWRYGPALPLTLLLVAFAALAGGLAGTAVALRPRPPVATLGRVTSEIAIFALVLALLLTGYAALASLLG